MTPFSRTRPLVPAALLFALGCALAPASHAARPNPGADRTPTPATRTHAAPDADPLAGADASGTTRGDRDTLEFAPARSEEDTLRVDWVSGRSDDDTMRWHHHHLGRSDLLLPHTPYGDGILTDSDQWRLDAGGYEDWPQPIADYNRVDRLALGLGYQLHPGDEMAPRFGARWAYSFGRKRNLYGMQLEQPLLADGWLALGAAMSRLTGHPDLQQTGGIENSLDLLFGRNDNRDYFETEGFGAYLASRLGDVTTASVHVHNDRYRSLEALGDITSLFWKDRVLRPNPAIDDGEDHTVVVQLERLSRRVARPHAGFYHYLAYERGGGPTLKGDFDYRRVLGDVRGVVRLSPSTTLALRALGGSTLAGTLPSQRAFTLGGFDGLRAHPTASLVGDQVALGQLEYDIDVWRLLPGEVMGGGFRLIAFGDAGQAWSDPAHVWDLGRQHVAADGGFGFATDDDQLRVYLARNLQRPDAGFVVSARIERPF